MDGLVSVQTTLYESNGTQDWLPILQKVHFRFLPRLYDTANLDYFKFLPRPTNHQSQDRTYGYRRKRVTEVRYARIELALDRDARLPKHTITAPKAGRIPGVEPMIVRWKSMWMGRSDLAAWVDCGKHLFWQQGAMWLNEWCSFTTNNEIIHSMKSVFFLGVCPVFFAYPHFMWFHQGYPQKKVENSRSNFCPFFLRR